MKMCPKCATENADTATACQHCGSPLQQSSGKTCPSGRHTMDPSWSECPYCRPQGVASASSGPAGMRTPTVFEGQTPPRGQARIAARGETEAEDSAKWTPLPPRQPRPGSGPPSPPRGAVAGTPKGPARQHTVYADALTPNPAEASAPRVSKGRKIVGLLVTYSHITYRQNFVVGDMVSMTGTDLDNVPIEEQFCSLRNYATIRAGSTYFTFIAISPQSTAGSGEQSGGV